MSRFRVSILLAVGLTLSLGRPDRAAPVTPGAKLAAEAEPAKDLYGDPLPDLAVARFGTARWREHGTEGRGLGGVACSPDGKLIAGIGAGITVWEAATGKPVDWFRPKTRPTTAALTPDGKALVTGGIVPRPRQHGAAGNEEKYRFERWEVGTGKLLGAAEIAGSHNSVGGDLSADGQMLLCRASEKLLRLYDATTGKMVTEIEAWPDFLNGSTIILSPDGKTVAVFSSQGPGGRLMPGKITLYEADTGKMIRAFGHMDLGLEYLAFAPDGKRLTAHTARSICVWDTTTGELVREIPMGRGPLAFSPDGRYLACVERAAVHVFDAKTFKEVRVIPKGSEPFGVPVCWLDDKTLVFAGERAVSLYDAETGKPLHVIAGHNGPVVSLTFSPDGRRLASGDQTSGEAIVWDVGTTAILHRFPGHAMTVGGLAFSPDGQTLATGDGFWQSGAGERHLRLFDLQTGQLKLKIAAHVNNVGSLSFAPDGRTIASAGGDGRWRLWDVSSGKRLAQVREGEGPDYVVAFAPDGKALLLGRQNELAVWKPDLSAKLYDLGPPGQERRVIGYATWLSDSKTVVSCEQLRGERAGPNTNEFLRWNGGAERPERPFKLATFHRGSQFGANQYALSPDGKLLAAVAGEFVSSQSNRIEVLDAQTGKVVAEFSGHPGWVTALAFLPDGKTLASGNWDTTILLWDVPTARLEHRWRELAAGGKDVDAAALTKDPDEAARFLRNRLLRMAALEYQARHHIAELDSDTFEVRQAASVALEKIGPEAEFALRLALDNDPTPEVKRAIRSILDNLQPGTGETTWFDAARLRMTLKCLETLGTTAAKKALRETADGPPDLIVTKKSRETLDRLGK
jgi:WD40 repeat protein